MKSHYILGLVGPSGCGKTTLIQELRKVCPEFTNIKSTTTRKMRSNDEKPWFNFISDQKFKKLAAQSKFANQSEYAGFYYGYEKAEIQKSLRRGPAVCAILESAAVKLLKAGYPLKLVRIIPQNQNVDRGKIRKSADARRLKIKIPVEAVIKNSFEPGGLVHATQQLLAVAKNLS